MEISENPDSLFGQNHKLSMWLNNSDFDLNFSVAMVVYMLIDACKYVQMNAVTEKSIILNCNKSSLSEPNEDSQ
jgi:hypothetical protein